MENIYHFAYGSNMNLKDLGRWCREHNCPSIEPVSDPEPGFMRGYRLIFNHYSNSRGGGALNITKSVGSRVCGVLLELTAEDFRKIAEKEGRAYAQCDVEVDLVNDGTVWSKTFKAKDNQELFSPTIEYLRIVLEGAKRFHFTGKCLGQIEVAAQQAGFKGNLDEEG